MPVGVHTQYIADAESKSRRESKIDVNKRTYVMRARRPCTTRMYGGLRFWPRLPFFSTSEPSSPTSGFKIDGCHLLVVSRTTFKSAGTLNGGKLNLNTAA